MTPPGPAFSASILALAFTAGPAAAGIVDGVYGDTEGCLYAATGESDGAEIFVLLNDDGVTTAVSRCVFTGPGREVGGAVRVMADCHEEGSPAPTPRELTLTPDHGGITIGFDDGSRWGPLMRCGR